MKGKHHVVVESVHLRYEFDIKRNITVVEGDSATGKTTLIDLLREYQSRGTASPVKIESDVKCEVYSGSEENWNIFLMMVNHSIVFIDEGYSFIFTKEFAKTIEYTDNYYVLISRRALTCLPYSIHEIYGIRTSGRYHFPEKIYHEFYPIYADDEWQDIESPVLFITEDSKSGYQFIKSCCDENVICMSAEGNSNIYELLKKQSNGQKTVVLADGAAFGAYIGKVLVYAKVRKNLMLYLPESFEWIILKSGVLASKNLEDILAHSEMYIDSRKYFSWERFFTDYLECLTADDDIRKYKKQRIGKFYLEGKNKKQILQIFPELIQDIMENKEII